MFSTLTVKKDVSYLPKMFGLKAVIIPRLNSGIRIRHNFFVWAVFLFEKLGTDSVNYADSGDIKILV